MPVTNGDGRSISQKIRDLTDGADDLSATAGELADEVAKELRDLRTDLSFARQQRHNLAERVIELTRERDEQIQKYNEVAERAEKQVRDAKDEARAANMNAAVLRDELAASERRRIALGNSIDNVQEDHEDLERQLAEANDRINELEADINPETGTWKQVDELESKLKVKDAVIREIRPQRDDLRKQVEIANWEAARDRSRRLSLATELNVKNDELNHERGRVGSLRQEIEKLKQEYPSLGHLHGPDGVYAENARLLHEIKTLRTLMEKDTQALITARDKVRGLEEQVRDLRNSDSVNKVSRDLVVDWRNHLRGFANDANLRSDIGVAAINAAITKVLNDILNNRRPGQVGPN